MGRIVHITAYDPQWPIRYKKEKNRSHPEEAEAYDRLKQKLASKYRTDPDAYTNAKASFIQRVITPTKSNPLKNG